MAGWTPRSPAGLGWFVVLGLLLAAAPLLGTGAPATAAGSDVARAEKRVALVIGNAEYHRTSPLRNPVNDARAMARALRETGFTVLYHENATFRDMGRAIRDLGSQLRDADVGLLYYAGHGVQVQGRNYLLPVDAAIEHEEEVRFEAVDLAWALQTMASGKTRVQIVILDACRNNPYPGTVRGVTQGLTEVRAPSGMLIAFAAAPGSVASDGDGPNGLYTGELVKAITSPGLRIEDVFKRVRQNVLAQTGGRQEPTEISSLLGDFVFAAPPAVAATPAAGPGTAPPPLQVREEARPAQGSLAVTSTVPGVEVSLGGQPIGVTKPSVALVVPDVPAGTVRLEGRKPGHRDWAREVRIDPDARVDVLIEIEPSVPQPGAADDGADMVRVPAGEFWMGSAPPELSEVCASVLVDPSPWDDAPECESNFAAESPRHRVWLDAFRIDRHEVTNAQYRRFVEVAGGHPAPVSWSDARTSDPSQPVLGVTWDDAKAYCEQWGKRLPTEAEWEKAARGTDGRRYPWGDQSEQLVAVLAHAGTLPVGSRPVDESPYGARDMAGNAREWVADWYDPGYYARSPERNPTGPQQGDQKVVRGVDLGINLALDPEASRLGQLWAPFRAVLLRAAVRLPVDPGDRTALAGFRCAKSDP
jgi:formylglycine-generating enzyme required for sulfatase activity